MGSEPSNSSTSGYTTNNGGWTNSGSLGALLRPNNWLTVEFEALGMVSQPPPRPTRRTMANQHTGQIRQRLVRALRGLVFAGVLLTAVTILIWIFT